tara:strand:+ start:946 stop:1377 length:432 start_codon:yes stop_codon:yes gene_type:complete
MMVNPTEYIGLGLAVNHLSFRVAVDKTPFAYGLKVRKFITLKPNTTEEQKKCIEVWANSHGLSVMKTRRIQCVERLGRWMKVLDAFEFLMSPTDRVKYHMLKWVLENPMPKIPRNKHRNWKRFMSWVEQHDEKYDELKSEYIN